MRRFHIRLLLVLAVVLSPSLAAQQPSSTPMRAPMTGQQTVAPAQRDPQALSVLGRAVSALGGSRQSTSVAIGNLTATPSAIPGPILWENSGSEFRYQNPGLNGPAVFVSGHGIPAISENGTVQRNIAHVAMVTFPFHLPAVVLAAEVNHQNVSVGGLQQVAVAVSGTNQSTSAGGASNLVQAIKISTSDQTDWLSSLICKRDWYFDATSLLPFRVDYLAVENRNALNTAQMTTYLSDYRSVGGSLIPFRITTFFGGQELWEVQLSSVQLGTAIQSSDFDLPATSTGGVQ